MRYVMNLQDFSEYLKILLQIANVAIIGYGLYKFLNRPHDTLSDEVNKLKEKQVECDLEIKELKRSLDSSHEKHREQDKTNKVFKKVFILLANFEVAFCQHTGYEHTEDLIQAKRELEEYLTGDHS